MIFERLSQDILKTLELVGDDGAFNVAGELLADENSMPDGVFAPAALYSPRFPRMLAVRSSCFLIPA